MVKNNPLVSIIIPVYNGSDYLREAIDSALNQFYENIEVIVINDGSNDKGKTEKVAKGYGKSIKYFKKPNGGVSSALNLGIKKSKGDFISWLSHDDTFLPEKIQKQINYIKENEEKFPFVLFSQFYYMDKNSKIFDKSKLKRSTPHNVGIRLFTESPIHGCTTLIPKECFKKVGMFNESLKCSQDYDFWFRLNEKYNLVQMKNYLVKSRFHENQGRFTIPKDSQLKEIDKMYERSFKFLKNTKKYNKKDFPKIPLGLKRKGCIKSYENSLELLKKEKFSIKKLLYITLAKLETRSIYKAEMLISRLIKNPKLIFYYTKIIFKNPKMIKNFFTKHA